MNPAFKSFFQRWAINTLAVLVAAKILKGIHYDSNSSLIVATLVLGVLNAFLRPIMMLLSFPLLIVTLGLFTIVINALVLSLVGSLLAPHFVIDGFWVAFKAAIIISLVSIFLNTLTGTGESRMSVHKKDNTPPPPPPPGKDGGGPVIDV